MIVTQDNYDAINESLQFENTSLYKDVMCGKKLTKGGSQKRTIEKSLLELRKIGLTDEEYNFYIERCNFVKPVCCLPKGHGGECSMNYDAFLPDKYLIKTKDCNTGPGDDDIIYKNRAIRTFPIQISNTQESMLKKAYDLRKNKIYLKAAIPIRQASTPYLVATSYMDIASFILKIEPNNCTFPDFIKNKLISHYEMLKDYYYKQGVYITDEDGDLCCPVRGIKIIPDFINEDAGDNQIQFGHVESVENNKYMTRGTNILLITRRGNLMQSDDSLFKINKELGIAYNHTRNRKEEV